jgi:hypothetical protein
MTIVDTDNEQACPAKITRKLICPGGLHLNSGQFGSVDFDQSFGTFLRTLESCTFSGPDGCDTGRPGTDRIAYKQAPGGAGSG